MCSASGEIHSRYESPHRRGWLIKQKMVNLPPAELLGVRGNRAMPETDSGHQWDPDLICVSSEVLSNSALVKT